MADYIGLDVLLKETAISVRRDGKRVWRGKCASDPAELAQVIGRKRGTKPKAGELSPFSKLVPWFPDRCDLLERNRSARSIQPCAIAATLPSARTDPRAPEDAA